MLNCGIYKIENIFNGNCYIGQSVNLKKRKYEHFRELKVKTHQNGHLQNSFDKYGEENFIFKIILYCEPEELTYYEQKLVDICNPAYNIRKECVTTGLGTKRTEERKKKDSEIRMGNKNPNFGIPKTDEIKRKMSETHKARGMSEEHKEKILRYLRNKPEDIKAKISEAVSKAHKGIPRTEETKRKISESTIGKKQGFNTSSIYVGVTFDKNRNKWASAINYKGKRVGLGRFATEKEAAIAYNIKAIELYGENARLNIIEEEGKCDL